MIKYHQNVKRLKWYFIIFNVLLYFLVNIFHIAHNLKRILQDQSCFLYTKHFLQTCYLMSTETNVCAGRQITVHQQYNQHCILDLSNLKRASYWSVQLYSSLRRALQVSDAVFWPSLAHGWNLQVLPQGLVTSCSSFLLIVCNSLS